jgi:hypothetical protein
MDDRLKSLRGAPRRDFLRWAATAAAALGVSRSSYLNFIGETGGVALADTAAAAKIQFSFHVVDGSGGLANWTLVCPNSIIATTANAMYSSHEPGKAVKSVKSERDLYYSTEMAAALEGRDKRYQMAVYMAGTNQAHTATPNQLLGQNASLVASVAAIQLAAPSLLNAIGVNPQLYGTAPGAPGFASVANSMGLVGLFNSAAAQTLLSKPGNAALLEIYHKAFVGLNGIARSRTAERGFGASKVSINLLGQNLASKLTPTAAELALYGLSGNVSAGTRNIGTAWIVGMKAMALGLTRLVLTPGYNNDPHGMFGGGDAAAKTVSGEISGLLKGLLDHAALLDDPSGTGRKMSEKLTVTVQGDTMKEPFNRNGWGDGSPQGSNQVFAMSTNGLLKTGWHGKFASTTTVQGFDPATGATVAGGLTGAAAYQSAAAAIAYAVSGGDERAIQAFNSSVVFKGLVNAGSVQ